MFSNRSQSIRRSYYLRCCWPTIETLETRAMLAGDVMVEVNASGDVLVTGDAADNQFTIATDMAGDIEVTGIDGTNIVFAGKSATSHVVAEAINRDLIIDSGAGGDIVNVNEIAVIRSLRVFTRAGADQFVVSDSSIANNFSVSAGPDNDFVWRNRSVRGRRDERER